MASFICDKKNLQYILEYTCIYFRHSATQIPGSDQTKAVCCLLALPSNIKVHLMLGEKVAGAAISRYWCILSHTQAQCNQPLWQLHSDFGDWKLLMPGGFWLTLLLSILQELQDLDVQHSERDASIAQALNNVEQQVSSRQVQISALQEESQPNRIALQAERQKVLTYCP